ncbi:hypothetical protein Tco_1411419 [Tanacetum coccineum]
MEKPIPCNLPPTPFQGHLKEQMGSPYRTCKTICMIENHKKVHKMKAKEDEGDMDVGWDIIVKDVESLRQFLTATIHTLPNLKPVTVYITPPDDDYVASTTSPTLDKQLNKFGKECYDITRFAEKANGNPVEDVHELLDIKTYDCETFIQKLLHQVSKSSHETDKTKREMKSHQWFQQLGGKFQDRLDQKLCGNNDDIAVVTA